MKIRLLWHCFEGLDHQIVKEKIKKTNITLKEQISILVLFAEKVQLSSQVLFQRGEQKWE